MYHTILVPLDGSCASEQALPTAAVLAQAAQARLILTQAAWTTHEADADPAITQSNAVKRAQMYLARVANRLAEWGQPAETAVSYAAPVAGILLEVDLYGVDLVVMTTHGRSGLGRLMYGSVAEAVLAKSPVPVLMVRPAASATPEIATQWGRSQVLVPLDGSAFAEEILPHATRLAQALNAQVTLCRAVAAPPPPMAGWLPTNAYMDYTYFKEEWSAAEAYLTRIADGLRQQGLEVRTLVCKGQAADVILAESQRTCGTFVAMTTHGRTGLGRLILGSVALQVLGQGLLTTLLLRPRALSQTPLPAKGVIVPQPAQLPV